MADFNSIYSQQENESALTAIELDDDMTFQFDEDISQLGGTIIQDSQANTSKNGILQGDIQSCDDSIPIQSIEPIKETYEEDIDDKFVPSNSLKSIGKEIIPPENFSPVIQNIYRSSFPRQENFAHLRRLNLKSVLCLIPEPYPEENLQFLEEENIQLFQLGMSGNKEPFVKIPHDLITEAIKIVINPENQPILIHCNRGKHRTGCLVGVLRRLQKWSLTIIFDEYRKFAAPKQRAMDQQFIELYDEEDILEYAMRNELLPLRW